LDFSIIFGKKIKPNIPEKGLGHILAVACLIDDVDVIGSVGSNIGYILTTDEND
jgi:hypothetical protein